MFYGNCSGCLQVPVPVQYWSPYIVPTKKSSFQIADILRHHMTNSVPSVCRDLTCERSSVKHVNENGKRNNVKRYIEQNCTTSCHRRLTSSRSDGTETSNRDDNGSSQPSALEPLKALCSVDAASNDGASRTTQKNHSEMKNTNSSLKFGINRILSDDFGKERNENENNQDIKDRLQDYSSCYRPVPYSTYALSAVHALQPPRYPPSPPDSDTLPGPYSILNTEMSGGHHSKRKRSWSRAVFSNLQRKGLEKRFEVQKYVTKPDRRQLAAMLGLTDAQVKVWFQNRRMKWRHTTQQQKQSDDEDTNTDSRDDETDAKNSPAKSETN